MAIANRIFNDTTDMRPEVKKRLQELQDLAGGVFESQEGNNLKDTANFKGQGYLSNKIPFARMWTAVRVTKKTDDEEDITITDQPKLSDFDFSNFVYEFPKGGAAAEYSGKRIKKTKLEKFPQDGFKIYSLGMNPTEQDIFEPKDGSADIVELGNAVLPPQRTSYTNFSADGKRKNLKPPAGITSVISTTQNSFGPVAGVLKTTINFTVYDFTEWDQIFSKYFLRPAAKVFVDFGYSDNTNFKLYNPSEFIKSIGEVEDFNEMIYGPEGQIAKSNYGIQCIQGQVTKFQSNLDPGTGAYKCEVEVQSKNAQLFDYDFKEDALKDIKKNLLANLDYRIIELAKQALGGNNEINTIQNTYSVDLTDENLAQEKNQQIADMFAATYLSSFQNNVPDYVNGRLGIFWKGAWKETTEKEEVVKIPSTGPDALYISIGFMEDVIMNAEFGKYSSTLNQFTDFNPVEFDSRASYTTFDKTLYDRQKFMTNNKDLPLLYPGNWNDTYNTRKGKTPEHVYVARRNFSLDSLEEAWADKHSYYDFESTRTEYDKKYQNRIPIREMFIKLSLVKKAIKQADSSKEVFQYIFNRVKESTGGGWNWGMDSSTPNNATLAILDRNFSSAKFYSEEEKIEKDQNEKQFFDDMFVFEPFSENSLIKTMTMNYSPGDGSAIASKIALQSLGSAGRATFPTSEVIEQTQRHMTIENLNTEDGTYKTIYDVEYFPPMEALSDLENIFCSFDSPKDEIGDASHLSAQAIYGSEIPSNTTRASQNVNIVALGNKTKDIINERGFSGDKEPSAKPSVEFKDFKAHLENNNYEFCANPYEFFTKKYFVNSVKTRPTILPIKASLTMHGFTGLEPSDRFKINHIPSRYMNLIFFQIMRITHNVSPGKFETNIDAQMRTRPDVNKELPINTDKENIMAPHALKNLHNLADVEKVIPFIGFMIPSVELKEAVNLYSVSGIENTSDFQLMTSGNIDDRAIASKNFIAAKYNKWSEDALVLANGCDFAYTIYTLPNVGGGKTAKLEGQINASFSKEDRDDSTKKHKRYMNDKTYVDHKTTQRYQAYEDFRDNVDQFNANFDNLEISYKEDDEENHIYEIQYTFKPSTIYELFINGDKFFIKKADVQMKKSFYADTARVTQEYFNTVMSRYDKQFDSEYDTSGGWKA